MKRYFKILIATIFLPLLVVEITIKELYRAWFNSAIISTIKHDYLSIIRNIK